jgi:DNA-binding CsgD family transcriptional regulator
MVGEESGQARGALTTRQLEIATLVAEGLTNREIAHKLFVSEPTVDGHLEQIRNRLGVRNRAQIGVWLGQQNAVASTLQTLERPPSPQTAPAGSARVLPGPTTDTVNDTKLAVSPKPTLRPWRRRRVKLWAGAGLAATVAGILVLAVGLSPAGLWLLHKPRASPAADPWIYTYAGMKGRFGDAGDEGPATSATLVAPRASLRTGLATCT